MSKLKDSRRAVGDRVQRVVDTCWLFTVYHWESLQGGQSRSSAAQHAWILCRELVHVHRQRPRSVLLLVPVAAFGALGTAGVPLIGASIRWWVWPLHFGAAVSLWIGLHSLWSAGLKMGDLVPKQRIAATVWDTGAAITVAGLGIVGGVLGLLMAFVLDAAAGGQWLLARLVISLVVAFTATLVCAEETARRACRYRLRCGAPRYLPLFQSTQKPST